MCTHFSAVSQDHLEAAIEAVRRVPGSGGCTALARELGSITTGSASMSSGTRHDPTGDKNAPAPHVLESQDDPTITDATSQEVYPGMECAVILVRDGRLAVGRMTFGYEAPWLDRSGRAGKLIANARLEDALTRPESMWADSLAHRRCVVPAWGFYEPHRSRTAKSPRTGRPIKQQVFFSLNEPETPDDDPGASLMPPAMLFFAGIYENGRFTIMTCAPNGSVSPVHDRMPVVLRPEEVRIWLGPRYASLVDRTGVTLSSRDAL